MKNIIDIERRGFLKKFGASAAAGSLVGAIPGVSVFNVAKASSAGGFNDYKAIVRIEMAGGCDSYNMLIPRDSTSGGSWYSRYLSSRGGRWDQNGGVGYGFDDILPISSSGSGDGSIITEGDFGLNPEFSDRFVSPSYGSTPGIQTLYNEGNLAFLTNVGSLVEPISKFEFENNLKLSPRAVNSHKDQVENWNIGGADVNIPYGWGARLMGKLLPGGRDNQLFPSCISLDGKSRFISSNIYGTNQPVDIYALGSSGAETLRNGISDAHLNAFSSLYDQSQNSFFARAYKDSFQSAKSFSETFNGLLNQGAGSTDPADGWGRINVPYQALEPIDPVNNIYPDAYVTVNGEDYRNKLLNQLQAVARLIKISRNESTLVNATRQVFVVRLPGFDTHSGQMRSNGLFSLMAQVSQAVGYFSEAMKEIGAEDEVTLFSMSEFGRTLSPNGSGTDHGWGGVQFMSGGAVNGGKIYGQHPQLEINSDNDEGMDWSFSRGQYIPTTSVDQMVATISKWMGASTSDLSVVFPNLSNFSISDLGFLNT